MKLRSKFTDLLKFRHLKNKSVLATTLTITCLGIVGLFGNVRLVSAETNSPVPKPPSVASA